MAMGQSGILRGLQFWAWRLALSALIGGMALAAPLGAEPAGQGVSLELTPDAARDLARRALAGGQPRLAAEIAGQMATQSPGDAGALMLQTAGLARSGRPKAAVPVGKQAFRLANGKDEHFEAAFLTAEAQSLANHPMAAKFWLRRASSFAHAPEQNAILKDAYRKLDARTPLTFGFALGAGPSNNVNGGSLHDTFWIWGIPIPIDEALPGFAASGQIKANWRVVARNDLTLSLYAKASHREVWLSDKAKAMNPLARSSDFASDGLDFGLTAMGLAGDRLRWTLELQGGQRWFAHGTQSGSNRLALGVEQGLEGKRLLAFRMTADTTHYPARPVADSQKLAAEVSLWQPLGRGAWAVSAGYADVASDAAGVAWRGPELGVEWKPATLPGDVALNLFGAVQMKDYWKTAIKPDVAVDLGATAEFSRLSVMGFAPTATVTASRNLSDLVVRDSFDLSLAFGLSSKF